MPVLVQDASLDYIQRHNFPDLPDGAHAAPTAFIPTCFRAAPGSVQVS